MFIIGHQSRWFWFVPVRPGRFPEKYAEGEKRTQFAGVQQTCNNGAVTGFPDRDLHPIIRSRSQAL